MQKERIVEVLQPSMADRALRGETTIATTYTDAHGGTDVTWIYGGLPSGLPIADNGLR